MFDHEADPGRHDPEPTRRHSMNRRTLIATAITALPLLGGLALAFVVSHASAQGVAEREGHLADVAGRTLYTYDKDTAGKSVCNWGCAVAWPPFTASEGASATGAWSIVVRDDGSRQWALDGKALYTFAADFRPGDVHGDGQGGVWHIVKRAASPSSSSTSPATVNLSGYAY
jgi:predicted lipoprotein with Yx(FWY)xxD motif